MSDYKSPLNSKYLANILYYIGYEFYKCINGAYYQFDVRENTQKEDLFGNIRNYTIVAINENEEELAFFSLDQNNKICDIEPFLLKYFEFNTDIEIIVENWLDYLVGGIKE